MNSLRIKELELRKKEAQQTIEYLQDYVSGRQLCDVMNQVDLIEKNKQVIINIDGLIKKLNA